MVEENQNKTQSSYSETPPKNETELRKLLEYNELKQEVSKDVAASVTRFGLGVTLLTGAIALAFPPVWFLPVGVAILTGVEVGSRKLMEKVYQKHACEIKDELAELAKARENENVHTVHTTNSQIPTVENTITPIETKDDLWGAVKSIRHVYGNGDAFYFIHIVRPLN